MGLLADIREQGLSGGYERYVLRMEPILQAMSARGIPVSPRAHAAAKAELKRQLVEINAEMQALVPDAVRKVKVYKTKPSKPEEWRPSGGAGGGLIRYIQHKGYPVPRNWKTGKDTVAELELTRLARSTKDPLFPLVRKYLDARIVLTNHLANWEPGPDGRVHPTYYTVSTGQLAAHRPSSMNAPNHKEEQRRLFRSIVVAPPGHTLLEFDYRSFHVQTLAFEAQDADLLRLARIDIHSFLTAVFLRLDDPTRLLSRTDADLSTFLSKVKRDHREVRNRKAKHALLEYTNGGSARGLYIRHMEFFDSQSEATRLYNLLDALFSVSAKWRTDICRQAHDQGYLMSRFGCIRYFSEVYKYKYSGSESSAERGDHMDKAKSFIPQNDAHCYLKDAMIALDEQGLLDAYWLATPIHDALLFVCPNELLAEALDVVPRVMSAPSPTLDGLSVEVEAKVGPSWDKMEAAA